MKTPPLTPEQEKTIAALIAQGWPREAAIAMVLESENDVIDAPAPTDKN